MAVAKCLDCIREGVQTARRATGKPLLCASHRRGRRTKRRAYSHETHILETYSITAEQYAAIKDAQGGKCAICRRATGAKRNLAVDHDHLCCKGSTSCGRCVRSILCQPCNRLLAHIRDDLETAERIVNYLMDPPGREVLAEWNAR